MADLVRSVIRTPKFKTLKFNLLDGLGKGFSVCEIIWNTSSTPWVPKDYKYRDQRFFQFDKDTGDKLYLRDEKNLVDGVELAPYKFVVHRPNLKSGITIRSGLARLAAVAYMCKGYTLKDWLAFMEVFGMPLRVGKYGEDATEKQKAALLSAVANIGIDAAAIIPESMIVEFVETNKGAASDKLFEGMANYLDSQVSKGVLGQTMTTDDGSSLSQAKVHNDVRKDLVVYDAEQLSATIQEYLVVPLIDLNYGKQKNYPEYKTYLKERENLVELSKALPPFIDRGLRVEESVIRDKFGLPDPEDDANILGPSAPKGAGIASVTAQESPTKIQTLILSKEKFKTKQAAIKWIEEHDFHSTKVDETNSSYRFRQKDPSDFIEGSFRTIELTEGVKAVIGRPKKKMAAVQIAAAEEEEEPDTLDDIIQEELNNWENISKPIINPIVELAANAKDYKDFAKKLKKAIKKSDSTEFFKSLALAMFKARGLGDGTDDI